MLEIENLTKIYKPEKGELSAATARGIGTKKTRGVPFAICF